MNDNVVELLDVSKLFGTFRALNSLNLSIRKGEFLTLLGPSGCGKTTTLRLIGGFEEPDSGRILINSADAVNTPPNKRDVNTVFQSYALFPHLTVWDNVAFGLQMRKVPNQEIKPRVSEILDMVQLTAMAKRKPSALSGGQQQRVALARALVCRPQVLLLDEPLASLDLHLRRQMQIELKRLQQWAGITFVFVTHDQEEALTVSDRVVIMNKGGLEQLGSPQEVYEKPSTLFVAQFIGDTNLLTGTVDSVKDGFINIETPFGPLAAADWQGLSPDRAVQGKKVTASVRPERIGVSSQEPQSGSSPLNKLKATCSDVVFLGPTAKVEFKLPTHGSISVLISTTNVSHMPRAGEDHYLYFSPGDCCCFPHPDGRD